MRPIQLTIASIYPLPFREVRSAFQPRNTFEIEGAAPGEVKYLTVGDVEQSEYAGFGKSRMITISAEALAADLVRCWTTNYPRIDNPDRACPGVMIIAGDKITDEEMEQLRKKQVEFARIAVNEADENFSKDRRDLITVRHLKLAEWLGVKGRPWQENIDKTEQVICPYCGTPNQAFASKCHTCREIINYERYNALQQQIQDGKFAEVQKAVKGTINAANRSVEELSQQDVDEFLATAAAQPAASGKKK